MLKLYALLLCFISLGLTSMAQYQVNESASVSTTDPNEFLLMPTNTQTHLKGSVFRTTTLNLSQDFVINASLYFGVNDVDGGDGIAFVMQREGPGYIGNTGAGIGYHRFDGNPPGMPVDVPGPVPSFIVEFDTYQNGDIFTQNIGDPAEDHLGFMTHGNAYHTNSTSLGGPIPFPVNIEDGQWHDVSFSWNVTTHTFTVSFLGQLYSRQVNMDSVVGGPDVYWGFTGSFGHAINEERVRFGNVVIGQPLTVNGTVINASCNDGAIDISASGGHAPYSYLWSNGSTSEDLSHLAPGVYTVTVTDAAGTVQTASFSVANGPDLTAPVISCPGNVTTCYNLLNFYIIPQVTATDNCSNPQVSYTITGATSRTGNGKNASGFFNPGTSTIVWKAKDLNNNISTCTTQVIINKILVNIPDVWAVNPGGQPNTIYLGYGPGSLTLTAQPSGGTAPYTFLWSNGATTPSINVSPSSPGTHTYIVLVRDAAGCYSLMFREIRVVDVRCGNNKVVVCHIPPGNPRRADEICISRNAVADHLAHGDKLGACNGNRDNDNRGRGHDDRTVPARNLEEQAGANASIFPNPTRGRFELRLTEGLSGPAQIMIMNANGTVVEQRKILATGKQLSLNFDLSTHAAGIYLVKVISDKGTQIEKILVQK